MCGGMGVLPSVLPVIASRDFCSGGVPPAPVN